LDKYSHEENLEMAMRIAERSAGEGGRAYFTGGFVRDLLRGEENKDIDIEVHQLVPARLEQILDSLGTRISIGESFGVYNLKGYSMDISMPRKEENRGRGHKDFDVCVDPWIGTFKASLRRDFTVNAMMQDMLTGEFVDHFNGREDLKNRIIRHVDPDTFVEDPLRVLRAAQFAARMEFQVAPETVELCRRMDLSALPRERILGELEKALLKARRPSVFFTVLREMDQLSLWFRELSLLETPLWECTMRRLDAAAQYRNRAKDPLGFMLAALVCDISDENLPDEYRKELHTDGLRPADRFLQRLTNEKTALDCAGTLSACRIPAADPPEETATVEETNSLFDRVTDPEALLLLFRADRAAECGNTEESGAPDFLSRRLSVYHETMDRPGIMGRDLVAAGLKPGKQFTAWLNYAHRLHLAGVDREEALRRILEAAEKDEKSS